MIAEQYVWFTCWAVRHAVNNVQIMQPTILEVDGLTKSGNIENVTQKFLQSDHHSFLEDRAGQVDW